jgi:hypothetical protein
MDRALADIFRVGISDIYVACYNTIVGEGLCEFRN